MTEKSKALQTRKCYENSAPPNQLYNEAKGTSVSRKHKRRKRLTNKPKSIKKMVIGTYISIITLNVNGLNAPTKRHRLAEWIQKQDSYICCLQETHFRPRDTYRLKVRGWKKILHANGNHKKAGVAILVSDKIDFKINTVTRDKKGHYKMIKGSIQKENMAIINIYAPHIGEPQYIRQMLTAIKREINNNTIIVGHFHTPLTPIDRSSRQKINKETQALNDTIDQIDLIDIFEHSTRKWKNTISSQVHTGHSPEQITSWVKNQALENLRKLKSYQASSATPMP